MNNTITKLAALHALATTLYIAAVASFLFYAPQLFQPGSPKTVLIPIAMLLLLVFSAACTGLLILGRPILWYLDGKKKEALTLLISTLGILFLIMFVAFFLLFLYSRSS